MYGSVSRPWAVAVPVGCSCNVALVQWKLLWLCNHTVMLGSSCGTPGKATSSGCQEMVPSTDLSSTCEAGLSHPRSKPSSGSSLALAEETTGQN